MKRKTLWELGSAITLAAVLCAAVGHVTLAWHSRQQATRNLKEALASNNVERIRPLISAGADVNTSAGAGTTALHRACMQVRDPTLVAWLLEKGADPDAHRPGGWTPLIEAADFDNLPAVRLLLQRGARVNYRDNNGQTALFHAVNSGDAETARLLLEAGADPAVRDLAGLTPLDWARRLKQRPLIELLSSRARSTVRSVTP